MARRSLTTIAPSLSDEQIRALGYVNRKDFYRNAYVTLESGERVRLDHLPSDSRIRRDYINYLTATHHVLVGANAEEAKITPPPLDADYTKRFSHHVNLLSKITSGHREVNGKRYRVFTGKTRAARNRQLRYLADYLFETGYDDFDTPDDFYQAYKETDE